MHEFATGRLQLQLQDEDTQSPETDSSQQLCDVGALLSQITMAPGHFNFRQPNKLKLKLNNCKKPFLCNDSPLPPFESVQRGSGLKINKSVEEMTVNFREPHPPNLNKSTTSTSSLRRKMAYAFSFSNHSSKLLFLIICSFLINNSSSSEVSSFQQQQQTGSSNFNANRNINSNSGLTGSGIGSGSAASNQLSQTVAAPTQSPLPPAVSTWTPTASPSQSELSAYFIAGLASQIRKINSTALRILGRDEPFKLQFRTVCPFGNIVYDDKFAISINSGGNMTYSTKPNEFLSSIYHSVADGQWHSITFKGPLISLDDHELHPQVQSSPAIHWDTNSSSENEQSHLLQFFDGFVGCIRVPKPPHDHPLNGKNRDQSHEESFYEPETPSEHRIFSLLDLFQLRSLTPFAPCTNLDINLTDIHPCFNPDKFILCSKCENGATCQTETTEEEMNNQCVCPTNTEETEYSGRYCEYPPSQVEDVPRQVSSSELENVSEFGENENGIPLSAPSNMESNNANFTVGNSTLGRMSFAGNNNAVELMNNVMTTTTTEFPPEMPFVLEGECPCKNDGVCEPSRVHNDQYYCNCNGTGYDGTYCDQDIDECTIVKNRCNHGLCVNNNGSYLCYCRPGFAGRNCDKDFDECLSHPCKNNGTCVDQIDDYRCECEHVGFTGRDCEIEIDECQSFPCKNMATCHDLLNDFACECHPGYTGKSCEIDIDECESGPCKNLGQCIDEINDFKCNCTDTGFYGQFCEQNVDDCLPSDPCQNGGTCIDGVKSYNCSCYPAYRGHDCEEDFDDCEEEPCRFGECFQKSNRSLYDYEIEVDPRLRTILGHEFDPEKADGYTCICQNGYEGVNCTIDIDECATQPCKNGICKDLIGEYACDCHPGYKGTHCETEIDECDPDPCKNGKCIDKIGDFECQCVNDYGGKDCSVPLTGCVRKQSPCNNNGKCIPKYNETLQHHFYDCLCNGGYTGEFCDLKTTMSFNGSGPIQIENNDKQFENGNYELIFKFRTTLPDVLLVIGSGLTYFSLTLSGGKLNLQSSLLNSLEGIFSSSGNNLADGEWHKVAVSVNLSHIALAAGSQQTIHPISEAQELHTGFNLTVIGGDTPDLKFLNKKGVSPFIGCMQDITINGASPIIPENLNASTIEVGCVRTNQCLPNPCQNFGTCTDLWRNFTCKCQRPYLGDRCQHEYIAATFGHESTNNSLASVEINNSIIPKFVSTFDISMFIRTRQHSGTIFRLGNEKTGNSSVFLEAEVNEVGNLVVQAKWSDVQDETNSRPEVYAVDGLKISNGDPHLISISRDKGLVKISVNGTEHFRKSVSNRITFNPSLLYIGGTPTFPDVAANQVLGRNTRAVIDGEADETEIEDSTTNSDTESNNDSLPHEEVIEPLAAIDPGDIEENVHVNIIESNDISVSKQFKGVIQDIRLNFSSGEIPVMSLGQHHMQHSKAQNHYVVEFFPLNVNTTYVMGEPLGKVETQSILNGTVSDDACKENNCLNGGNCETTWNDFKCNCAEGFDGDRCQHQLPCAIMKCPRGSTCHNIGWIGFECVSEASFDGNGTSLHYKLESNELDTVSFSEIGFRIRSKRPGSILYLAQGSQSLRIALEEDIDYQQNQTFDAVVMYIDGDRYYTRITNLLDGRWHNISTKLTVNENAQLLITVDEKELKMSPIVGSQPVVLDLNTLIKSPDVDIVLGSHIEQHDRYTVDHHEHSSHPEDAHDMFYRGCLDDVKIGTFRLPFVTPNQLKGINLENLPLARKTAPTFFYIVEPQDHAEQPIHLGCILCYDVECENDGRCENPAESFDCSCQLGFEGQFCEVDIDECVHNECKHNSLCIDMRANYSCVCPVGYAGWKCDIDIDECKTEDGYPKCQNGGLCHDDIGTYTCVCTEEYLGKNCEKRKRSTCADDPCENGATCYDRHDRFPSDVTFQCECQIGWEGETCAVRTDYCKKLDVRCLNGGSCFNKPVGHGFECLCMPGYDGPKCEIDIDDCANNTCVHGECVDHVNGFSCACHTGFYGDHCEIDRDECEEDSSICPPTQICSNLIGSYICQCPDLSMCGYNCDILDPCFNRTVCFNNGVCKSTCPDEFSKYATCDCRENYGGEFCELLQMAHPDQPIDILLIIIPIIIIILIAATVSVIILVRMARKKRATRGVYSPSAQEYCNPRVELDNVMKPPPEERLI